MSVQIALAPNPDLCSGRWAFRGCDAVELQMPAIILEGHVRTRHGEAAHDGELCVDVREGRIAPLPVGPAQGIAYEVQARGIHGEALDAEPVMPPRHLEHEGQRANLRHSSGGHPVRIADDEALRRDAGRPGEELDPQGTVDGDRASGANGNEVQEGVAKKSRLHRGRKSRDR